MSRTSFAVLVVVALGEGLAVGESGVVGALVVNATSPFATMSSAVARAVEQVAIRRCGADHVAGGVGARASALDRLSSK
jgi:hypothetical protein